MLEILQNFFEIFNLFFLKRKIKPIDIQITKPLKDAYILPVDAIGHKLMKIDNIPNKCNKFLFFRKNLIS